MAAQVAALRKFKADRNQATLQKGFDAMARAAADPKQNLFGAVVEAAGAGVTHGEICAALRRELGFGQPLAIV